MAYFHSPQIVKDGLVLLLDAGNPKSYSGTGTLWFDLSGNKYNFGLVNTPTFSNGVFSFDGTNQYTSGNYSNLYLAPTGIRTLEIWCKINSFPTVTGGLFSGQLSTSGTLQVLNSGKFRWHWDDGNTGNSNTTLVAGAWNQITVVLNNYFATYYYNGAIDKTAAISSDTVASQVTVWSIGRQNRDFTGEFYYLNCDVSIARQYSKELSAEEVLQNYNATKGRFGL